MPFIEAQDGTRLFYEDWGAGPPVVLIHSWTDFRADMAHFKVPTLIVHGDADATVPMDVTGKAAAAAIPHARFAIYKGAPHAAPFTQKDRLTDDLLAFLKG